MEALQNQFNKISNKPHELRVQDEELEKISLNWKQQVAKLEEDYETALDEALADKTKQEGVSGLITSIGSGKVKKIWMPVDNTYTIQALYRLGIKWPFVSEEYIYNFVKGNFLSIIKNHKGSKIFQKYLKSTHSDEILHLIFIELSPNLEELIIDPYANYFCKKFFSYLNPMDRIEFLKCIQK